MDEGLVSLLTAAALAERKLRLAGFLLGLLQHDQLFYTFFDYERA